MTQALDIRLMDIGDLARAVDWAAAEGWNPGLDDTKAFFAADNSGFFMGWLGDRPVSAISLVKYGTGFAFLGLYIVDPEFRGKGYGIAAWNAALKSAPGRVVGLDGVVAQQENYRKSGFVLAHNNIRYGGKIEPAVFADPAIREVTQELLPSVIGYDRGFFPEKRDAFIVHWTTGPATHHAITCCDGGALQGYGVIRACRQGYKVGPLFAETPDIARRLFAALAAKAGGAEIYLDVPEPNREAVRLAETFGMAPVFETARMYRGPAPALPIERIFGITSFELG
jgi:GNAT superfamily N-acetyltransferase